MNITIIGTGYVGLVTGVSLTVLGHKVICVGRDPKKIRSINVGKAPFYEPGLEKLLKKSIAKKLLIATDNLENSVKTSDISIIAVGTPTVNNKIDLSFIEKASEQIGLALKNTEKYHVVVVKSTVVPMTTETVVKSALEKSSRKKIGQFGLCMVPEFLREGQAVKDALNPDRVVIGAIDAKSAEIFSKIYKKIKSPQIITNLRTAEMTKYAANALFATLISYSNEIAGICEAVEGIDAVDVWNGVHLDKRLSPTIGKKRIKPGILNFILSGCGYGGSCFPKDTKSLASFSDSLKLPTQIIRNVIDVNERQPERVIMLLKKAIGSLKNKKIAVLGLAFKPKTDDMRESPAFPVIKILLKEQANVVAHDPVSYKQGVPRELEELHISLAKDVKEAIGGADAVVIITAWGEYKRLTPTVLKKHMKTPVIIDGRRILSKDKFLKEGVMYKGIGFSA